MLSTNGSLLGEKHRNKGSKKDKKTEQNLVTEVNKDPSLLALCPRWKEG